MNPMLGHNHIGRRQLRDLVPRWLAGVDGQRGGRLERAVERGHFDNLSAFQKPLERTRKV